MDHALDTNAGGDQLASALAKAGQVTASLSQIAERLVPAMVSFESTLTRRPPAGDIDLAGAVDTRVSAPLAGIDRQLAEMRADLHALTWAPAERQPAVSPGDLEALGGRFMARLEQMERTFTARLDEMTAAPKPPSIEPQLALFGARLLSIEARLDGLAKATTPIAATQGALAAIEAQLIRLQERQESLAAVERTATPKAAAAGEDTSTRIEDGVRALKAVSDDLAVVAEGLNLRAPALVGASHALVTATAAMGSHIEPLTQLGRSLGDAIDTLSRQDPAQLAGTVTNAVAEEIRSQLSTLAPPLETRMDAAAANGGQVLACLAELQPAIAAMTSQLGTIETKIAGVSAAGEQSIRNALEILRVPANRLGQHAGRVEAGLTTVQAAVEALSTRIETVAETHAGILAANLGGRLDGLAATLNAVVGDAPQAALAEALQSLQAIGEAMKRTELPEAPRLSPARGAGHVELQDAVDAMTSLGERFAMILKRLERRLDGVSLAQANLMPGHTDLAAISDQMKDVTAEFLAIAAALSSELASTVDPGHLIARATQAR